MQASLCLLATSTMKDKYVDIRERRKIPWKKIITSFLTAILLLLCYVIIYRLQWLTQTQALISAVILGISMILSSLFHGIGHLVTGLLSGYQLLIFRLGPLALVADPMDPEDLEESIQKMAEEMKRQAEEESRKRAEEEARKKAEEEAKIQAEGAKKLWDGDAPPEPEEEVSSEIAQEELEEPEELLTEEEKAALAWKEMAQEQEEAQEEDEEEDEEEESRGFHLVKTTMSNGFSQCVMSPPEEEDYKDVPYELYLRGGGIANLISIPISLLLLIFFLEFWYYVAIFPVVALIFALTSLIPIRFDGKPNDAYIKKLCDGTWDDHASFVNQLQIISAYTRGMSVGDMPETWFFGKFDMTERMSSNPLTVAIWQSTADRFLRHGELFQAKIIYESIGNQVSLCPYTQQSGVYRLLYTMILEGRVEEVRIYPIPKFMRRAMKKNWKRHLIFPRYQYGYAMLVIESGKKMKETKLRYDKIAKGALLEGERLDQEYLMDELKYVEIIKK